MKYKLKDICLTVTDGSHFSPKAQNQGYPMLSVKDMKEYGFDYTNCKRISEEDFAKMKNNGCVPQKDDVLVAKDGSYLKEIFVCGQNKEEAILSSIAIFRPNKNIVNPYYLCYLLKSPKLYNYISTNCVSGSALPRIVLKAFKEVEMEIPQLIEQEKVVKFLKPIDDKMQKNNAINRNLLEQAVAIFSEMIWSQEKNGVIGDYCTMKSGFAFKSSWWTDSGIKVIKIGDITQDNLRLNTCSCVTEDKVEKASDFLVKAGDLVLAMTGATIGKYAMIPERNENVLVNQRVGKFFLGDEPIKRLPFIYCTLKMEEVYYEIIGRGQGSAQPNISASDVMSIPCVIPEQEVIDEFNNTAEPLFANIVKNQKQNEQLIDLRDTLLPKLMSGELDVSDLDI